MTTQRINNFDCYLMFCLSNREEMAVTVPQVCRALQAHLDLLACKVLLAQLVPRGPKESLGGMALLVLMAQVVNEVLPDHLVHLEFADFL